MRVFFYYLSSEKTIKVRCPFKFLADVFLFLKGHTNFRYVGSWKEC